jgi:peptide/nickel transport system substrate-binding protein
MKKLLAIMLALVLCLGCVAFADSEEEIALPEDSTRENTLIVGSPDMNGDFIDGFGSSAYDTWVKNMTMEYTANIEVTAEGEIVDNPMVVESSEVAEDEDGNKTYTYKICEDLKWSDGEPITAADYVGAMLWKASPAWVEAGASTSTGYGLLGYQAYNAGDAERFAAVALIDEYTFALTIDAAELPYYWEQSYTTIQPIPMHIWAPDLTIDCNEEGAKFAEDYATVLAAMQNVANTERFAPTVTGGPFTFISFENGNVTLKANPYFKGDLDGVKPQLLYVVQKTVPSDTDVDQVIARDIDIVPANVEGLKIEAAKASPNTSLHSYLRYGYGMISMLCNWGPTADPNVRWALGYLIDRNEVNNYALGGYGGIVQGMYGYSEWAYQEVGDELEELLTPFNLNIEKANELLDQTEWKYEADGVTPFDASKANAEGTYMRYNDKGEKLVIRHMGTDGLTTTDIIEIQYAANAPLAGVDFQVTKSDFNALLDNYYYSYEIPDEDKLYSTFNMGNSFGTPNDPYESWHSDFYGTWNNACQVNDPELDELIMALRSTEPGDEDAFLDNWLAFQVRWQQLLPQIPLYSNEYFDIYDYAVKGIETTPFHDFSQEICKIYKVSDAEAEKEVTTAY